MTNPTATKLDDLEHELMTLWTLIDNASQTDPSQVITLVKRYSDQYSKYRIARVASNLWSANKFTPARELLIALEDM